MLPLSIWSWQDTVKAVLSGKAVVVDIYPEIVVRAVNLDMPVPSVIALREYAPMGKAVSVGRVWDRSCLLAQSGFLLSYRKNGWSDAAKFRWRRLVCSSWISQRPAFTRRNVFLRDGYRCQYCSKLFRTSELSLDHVEPRCFGGQLTWYVLLPRINITHSGSYRKCGGICRISGPLSFCLSLSSQN